MSKSFELFTIGIDENLQEVQLPRFHTLIAGATGTGKTQAIKKIINEMLKVIPDLKIIIFDLKETGRDWQNFGQDVPIYIKSSTDIRFLRDLIESSEGRKIDWFLYELNRAVENTQTWKDVLHNLETELEKVKQRYPKGSIREEKIGTLIIYMKALVEDLDRTTFINKIQLPYQINVIPLNKQSQAFKELAAYSYGTEIITNMRKILFIIDEASLLVPRSKGTGCKHILQRLFKAGREAELFGIVSDQEITAIDESIRRQCWNWILGMQTELGAQERTIKQIPGNTIKKEDISTLGVGWFYAVIRLPSQTTIKKFYLIPSGIDTETAKKLVTHEITIEQVMQDLSNNKTSETSSPQETKDLSIPTVNSSSKSLLQERLENIEKEVTQLEQS